MVFDQKMWNHSETYVLAKLNFVNSSFRVFPKEKVWENWS